MLTRTISQNRLFLLLQLLTPDYTIVHASEKLLIVSHLLVAVLDLHDNLFDCV